MKKILFIIFVAFLLIVSALLWWRYVPLTDGEYVVANSHIAWHMSVSNGVLSTQYIENKHTGEKLTVQGNDFAIRLGHAATIGWAPKLKKPGEKWPPYTIKNGIVITPANCRAVRRIRGFGTDKFCLYNPALNCNIYLVFNSNDDGPWLKRTLVLESCDTNVVLATDQALHQVQWQVASEPSLGGKGQPVLLDNTWFIGLAHPAGENTVADGIFQASQYPGYRFDTDPLQLMTLVVGGGIAGDARMVFNQYFKTICRPSRSLTLYNTWCDWRADELTEGNVLRSVSDVNSNLSMYSTGLEVCAVDDGWFNPKSIWQVDSNKFTENFLPFRQRIETMGTRFGLWLPLCGLYLDIPWGKAKGFETAGSQYYCLSGKKYNRELREQLKTVITAGNIQYFKHDFNYFWCGSKDHGHFPTRDQSTEVNVDALLGLLEYERSLNTNIFLAITTGIWPSPWWLQYVDTIWMGGGDHDYNKKMPATRGSSFEMNYRDDALYDMLVRKGTIFPLSALMTHGIVDGRHVPYAMKREDDEGWANYVMNYLGRGTMMREFYITPDNLTPLRWEVMARGIRWAKSLDACMADSSFFLGDPGKGELFGYTGTHADKRYISVRNPALTSETVSLSQLMLTNGICRVVYPYHAVLHGHLDEKLHLPGETVMQAETYPKKQLTRPVPAGVRAQVVAATEKYSEYIVSPEPGQETCNILSPVEIKNVTGDTGITSSENDGTWTLSFKQDKHPVTPITILSSHFSSNGVLSCALSVASNTHCTVQLINHNNTVPHACTINGTAAAVSTLTGDDWRVSQIRCSPGLNKIKCGVQFAGRKEYAGDVEILLQVNTELPEYRVRIDHDPLPGYNRYDTPFPILQTTLRKTLPLVSRRTVMLDTSSGRLYAERKLTEQQLKNITSACISMDIFDVNSGKYDDKKVFLNNTFIGKLPVSPEPLAEWHTVSMPLEKDIVTKLQLDNIFAVRDTTGDHYKIRNIRLQVTMPDGTNIDTYSDNTTYSTSLSWKHGEGKELPRNGVPVTVLSF